MTEVSLLVKATIVLAAGLAGIRLTRGGRASVRHLVLASTFGALLALPVVMWMMPGIDIEVAVPDQRETVNPISAASAGAPRQAAALGGFNPPPAAGWPLPSWPTLLRTAWAAGTAAVCTWLAVALLRLRRVRRAALPWLERRSLVAELATAAGVRRPVEILLHEDVAAPLTCGVRHPAILLPSDAGDWAEADLRRALVHELEHVARGDWAVQLGARAACALYWFHPAVWVAWRHMCLEAERAADDAVLRSAESTDYAEQLVRLARRMVNPRVRPALAMASRSDLAVRVSAVLDGDQRRGPNGPIVTSLMLAAAAAIVLAVAPLRAVATSGDPTVETQEERRGAARLDRRLYRAAERGDVDLVAQLIASGANVNATIEGDGTPLIGAAREGRENVVRLLLDRGADPNRALEGDGNPLIMAAREGHTEVVELLLDRGANINQIVPGDENALIQAAGEGHLAVVKLLVSRDADVNARAWAESAYEGPRGEWRTPLSMALKGGHQAVVDYLKSVGARE